MSNEYKLSYAASEIDAKLKEIGEHSSSIDKLSKDISNLKENGTGAVQPDWNQNDETSPDYIKNKPFYDKVITISETREFIDPIIDKEFAQLLYENRHTALYTVGGKSFTFSNDEASSIGYCWAIIDDNGETIPVQIVPSVPPSDPSNTESTVYDTILGARNTVFTVNYEKVVRLIDEKFLPEHSWNNLEDKPFGEWENEIILEEHIVNVENNWADIYGLQSLELIDNQNTNYYVYFDDELRDAFIDMETGSILSDTNGEAPVIIRNGMDNSLIINGFPDGEHRVKIVARTKYFKHLDEKYIPDTITRTNYVDEKTDQLNENINQLSENINQLNENTSQLSENINQLNEKTDQLSEEVQNLPKNYNDLKDKPLGDVIVTEVLSEAVVTSVADKSYVSDSAKNKFYSADVSLPSAEYIVGEEYIVEINGEIHRLTVCRQYEMQNGCYNTGFNVDSNISCYFEPKPIVGATFCIYAYDLGNSDTFTSELWIQLTKDVTLPATIKIMKEVNGIKQLDEKYIPDTIARKVEHSWDTLENKPFYDFEVKNVILPTTTLVVDYAGMHYGSSLRDLPLPLVAGNTYKIIYNDEEFILKAKVINEVNPDNATEAHLEIPYLGNLKYCYNIYPGTYEQYDTGESFLIHYEPGNKSLDFRMPYEEGKLAGSIKLSIIELSGEIKQIDEKFLPEHSWNNLEDKPFSDTRYIEEVENNYNLTYDGSLEGREYVGNAANLYVTVKLSDEPLTKEQLLGCVVKWGDTEQDMTITESDIDDRGSFLSVKYLRSVFETSDVGPATVGRGLWTSYDMRLNSRVSSISKTVIETVEHGELKQLDEKYIPDTIARKTDDDFVITLSRSEEGYVSDKMFEEIIQASMARKNIVCDIFNLEMFNLPRLLPFLGMGGSGFQFGILSNQNGAINPIPLFICFEITPFGVDYQECFLFDAEIGLLNTTKKSLIGAINELYSEIQTLKEQVATLGDAT